RRAGPGARLTAAARPAERRPERPADVPAALAVRSGAGGAQRCCDLLDGRGLCGADALPALTVGGGDLVGQVEHEAAVVLTFFCGRLARQQRHRVAKVREPG